MNVGVFSLMWMKEISVWSGWNIENLIGARTQAKWGAVKISCMMVENSTTLLLSSPISDSLTSSISRFDSCELNRTSWLLMRQHFKDWMREWVTHFDQTKQNGGEKKPQWNRNLISSKAHQKAFKSNSLVIFTFYYGFLTLENVNIFIKTKIRKLF